MNNTPDIILIPSFLDEADINTLPASILEGAKKCQIFFVENERSARRFLKMIWKEMVIDSYEWHTIHKAEEEVMSRFLAAVHAGKTIGIISEAGCPCIADPGQLLVSAAQKKGAKIKPLVGPNSIILALMASGLNGQQFKFNGYLPIDNLARSKAIRDLEQDSLQCTQIFIETPYRNKALAETILQHCKPATRLCIAVNLTGAGEFVQTKTIADWKNSLPEMHKRPAIFLIYAGII
jgi:16S rRNA (cytidine1402-2'-O)-methyltransferase